MTVTDGPSNKNYKKGKEPEADHLTHDELKKAYDHSPIGVLAIDTTGIINYANSNALAYFNSPKNKIFGRSLFSLFDDATPDKVNEGRLMRSEEIVNQEFKVKMLPAERWVFISSQTYDDSMGNVLTYLFIRDISRLKKKENLFSYLNEAAAALAKMRDTSSALKLIAQLIVPKFANWFTIDRITDDRLELLLLEHEDKEKIKWAYQYRNNYPADLNSNSGPAVVVKTGKPGFVPIVTEEMVDVLVTDPVQREEVRKIGLCSVIIVPMWTDDTVTGLVNFISSSPDRHFDETDLEFAQNFANLISLALQNTRLNDEAANEIALRKRSEEQFRFLTDAIPHKLWTSGPDGRATYYNQQWHDYTGINGFEALREKIWDFIHPDDRAAAAVEWPTAIRNGEPTEIEHRLMRYDGIYRWHLSRFAPFKDDIGQTVLWVGTSTDVHEQRIAGMELVNANEELTVVNEEVSSANEELASMNEELAVTNEELTETQVNLQRSEKLFRSIALNIPKSLIIVIDGDHRFVVIEGDLMEKMGYHRSDYEGKHPADISAERYQASKHLYDRVMAGEQFSVERKSETGENYIVHFVPLRNDSNEVDAGLIIALDITDIKRAEEKSAKLAAIVESSDDAIIGKTTESVIISWNSAAERMFGYTAEEMIGQTIYKIIPTDRWDEEPRILSRLMGGERIQHFETKRMTKDGRLLDVSLTISPVKDVQGNIISISKIARDITEKKLEEQRKNDFIGMVSHELKTPLTTLSAIIQMAAGKLKNSEDAFLASAVERAGVQVKRMNGMINGFLNISRLEAGKMSIEFQVFDLEELLHETLDETRLIVGTHTFSLAGSGQVKVNADRDKISSVISNLVGNAVKYSPKGKHVEMAYQVKENEVTVCIKDEGIGIKPQEVDKVFDRYYRVETDYSRHVSGFGIGLYLSAEIIKRHNGKIWVESKVGKGSSFYFTLPVINNSSGKHL